MRATLADVRDSPMPQASARAPNFSDMGRPSRCEVKPAWRLNAKQETGVISHG
jgi:hypothetical protein